MTDSMKVTTRTPRTPGADFMETRASQRRGADGGFGDYLNQAAAQVEPPAARNVPAADKTSRQPARAAQPKDEPGDPVEPDGAAAVAGATVPAQVPNEAAPVTDDAPVVNPGEEPVDSGEPAAVEPVEPIVSEQAGFSPAVAAAMQMAVDAAADAASAETASRLQPEGNSQVTLPVETAKPVLISPVLIRPANGAVTDPESAAVASPATGDAGAGGTSGAPSTNPLAQSDTAGQKTGQEQPSANQQSDSPVVRPSGELVPVETEPAPEGVAERVTARPVAARPVDNQPAERQQAQKVEEQRQEVAGRQRQLALDHQTNRAGENQPPAVPVTVETTLAGSVAAGAQPDNPLPDRSRSALDEAVTLAGVKPAGGESNPLNKILAVEKPAETPVDMAGNIEDIVKSVRTLVQRNQSVVQLRLDPPELGALRIEMKMEAGGLSVQLQTGSLRTQQLLQQNNHELRAALEASGFQTGPIEIQLRLDLRNGESQGQQNPTQDQGQTAGGQQQGGAFQQEFQARHQQEFGAAGFEEGSWREEAAGMEVAAVAAPAGGREFREWQFTRLDVTV